MSNIAELKIISNQDASGQNMFDQVRHGFLTVAEMAQHVTIRYDRLEDYAKQLQRQAPENVFDTDHHYSGDAESTAAYVLCLDSVNFGSGYQPHLLDEGWQLIDKSLYYTLSTRLKNYFEENGTLTATMLRDISAEKCAKILGLNYSGSYSCKFATVCASSLQELGRVVGESYDGSYLSFVRSANCSAGKMLGKLASMHHFNDVHSYHGVYIPFYKRAQITVADLQLAFRAFDEKLFTDIDLLTMFADNGVPHVLRIDGILEYSDELARRIDQGEEIISGSEEEIEIRACGGHVVELLAAQMNMIAMDIDHILWHRSVENKLYRSTNPHRTLSQYY